jgi:putative RecB family exonuclease
MADAVELPPHLSVSQVTCYLGCPRKFRFRYVEHRPVEHRSADLALGSAVHGAIEWFTRVRGTGTTPELDRVLRAFRVEWHALLAGDEYAFDEGDTDESLGALGATLVELYVTRFLQETAGRPEERFEVALPLPGGAGTTVPLVGLFDEVDEERVTEIKTTARKSPLDTWSLQLGTYAFAFHERYGRFPRLRVVQLVKTKVPKIEVEEMTVSARDVAWTLEVLGEARIAMAAGAFPPNPSWMCGRCEYRKACRSAA